MRRVVVTGLGLLTPLGLGTDTNWKRLVSGQVGINKIDNFDVSDLPCKIAGQIPKKSDENHPESLMGMHFVSKLLKILHFSAPCGRFCSAFW